MNPLRDVAVIIVGLNARAFVEQSLASIERAEWRGRTYETIYVDNGSTDGSAEMARQRFPRAQVIANPTNVGFCPAANQGTRAAHSRHYFFLNDDTIVHDDAIALLVEYLDGRPEVGAVGSRLLNHDGSDQWSGRRFPSPLNFIFGRRSVLSRWLPNARPLARYLYRDQLQAGKPFAADWVSAAAVMARAEVFERIGGFAEDYYYWHEAIFCDRVRQAGYEVTLHPQSKITHFEGHGSGKRSYAARRWHIINFHRGAYRCYCERYRLGRLNPRRALAALALGTRAVLLLAANRAGDWFEKLRPARA